MIKGERHQLVIKGERTPRVIKGEKTQLSDTIKMAGLRLINNPGLDTEKKSVLC